MSKPISQIPLAFSFVFLISACSKPPKEPIHVIYEGEAVSFSLEEFGEGWSNVSGTADGPGFKQASGELEYIFPHAFEGQEFEMDSTWKGRYFKLTVNFSGDQPGVEVLDRVLSEIGASSYISVYREQKAVLVKCLEVEDPDALASHTFEPQPGEGESMSLTDAVLLARGYSLKKLAGTLSQMDDSHRYHYRGTVSDVFAFELDVTDHERLSSSLMLYGLKLSDCEMTQALIRFD